ncbi:MAG: hypothetical protein AABY15_06510 [Nanoarchaeota archaeon]|mgnify:CR=1 FL=1
MTFKLKAYDHFFNTMATKKLALEVLEKVKTAPVEHGKIIVYYSDEGMCIFDVLEDTDKVRHVEFISTAS